MSYNSRKSNFHDSHALREVTLAYSEKYHAAVAVGMKGGGEPMHLLRVFGANSWACKSTADKAVTYSRDERGNTEEESDS